MTQRATTRDHTHVLREYDAEKWPAVLARIETLIEAGETSLARALTITVQDLGGRASEHFMEVLFRGVPSNMPTSFAYGGNQSCISAHLRNLAGPDTDTVVELGSGFGRNLFWLWLHGGPRGAVYTACEFTAAGRQCTERLAALEPAMRVAAVPFDFHDPDYSVLPEGHGGLLVFSCHGFEQVPMIDRAVFDRLLALGRPLVCVHFEPIGWQIRAGQKAGSAAGSSESHAREHDYNRNLWPLLEEMDRAGNIVIEKVEPDYMCINPKNGTSLVQWRSP